MIWNKGVTLSSHLAHLFTQLLGRLEASSLVMYLRPRPRVGIIASHVSSPQPVTGAAPRVPTLTT